MILVGVGVALSFWISIIVRTYGWFIILGNDGPLARITGALGHPIQLLFTVPGTLLVMVNVMLPYAALPLIGIAVRRMDWSILCCAVLGRWKISYRERCVVAATLQWHRGVCDAHICHQHRLFCHPGTDWNAEPDHDISADICRVDTGIRHKSCRGIECRAHSHCRRLRADLLVATNGISNPVSPTGAIPVFIGSCQTVASCVGGVVKVRRKLSTLYVVLIIAFLVAPAAIAVPVSFNNIPELEFPPSGFSLQWYAALFNSSSGWRASMALSAEVAISATAIALLVGAPAAWALMRRPFRFRRAVLILLVAPLVVPTIVLATGQLHCYCA